MSNIVAWVQVRHGQYVEGGRDDSTQVLTDLGRLQAELTGKRLAGYLPEVLVFYTVAHV